MIVGGSPCLVEVKTTIIYRSLSWSPSYLVIVCKKSLKISKGLSEDVNRRTDNTITKSKRTKGQTTINKTLYRKLKIEQHEPH